MLRRKLLQAPLLVSTVLALVFFAGMATTAQPAFAHGASQLPHGTATLALEGKVYQLTQGKTLRVPITLPDGSKGFASATFDADPSPAHTSAVSPSGVSCQTGHINLSFYNVYGSTLGSYTLFQYWCWDGTNITEWDNPYEQSYGQFGWSLVNHAETLVLPPNDESDKYGESQGIFRFNGPFGIGCKSGRIDLYFYNTGNYTALSEFDSEFGC